MIYAKVFEWKISLILWNEVCYNPNLSHLVFGEF
jgi:hypothetical protein